MLNLYKGTAFWLDFGRQFLFGIEDAFKDCYKTSLHYSHMTSLQRVL